MAAGAFLAIFLAAVGAPTAVRLLPFLLFSTGASGLWQARDKT